MNERSFIFAPVMRSRDDHKEQLIRDRALEMIVEKGFDGFSMQKLARAAGLSPGTLYIYFKDREDLILRICAEETKKMFDASLKNFDPAMTFSEGLKIQWMNRARYFIKNPLKMHFLEQIRHSPFQERSGSVIGDDFKKAMSQFVHNAIKRNELIKVPVEVFWSIAYAPLYNLVKFHHMGKSIGGRRFSFSDKSMLQTLQLVLKALRP